MNEQRNTMTTENTEPIVKTYGHGSITLTAYPSSGRIKVEATADNSVMDWSELFEFVDEIRKPRHVATVEELDALPAGTIILDGDPDALLKAHTGNWRSLVDPEEPFKSNRLTLPATVLYSPVVGK